MAEQIIGDGLLNEDALYSMNIMKERMHIGATLISNSGNYICIPCSYNHTYIVFNTLIES